MSEQQNIPRTWDRPAGASLKDWMETRIARFSTRKYDFDALKFQADFDPKYRRGQMRYIGTGGTGVATDSNTIPSEHFTFSTMILPAGHEGPLHIHNDVEEVFFVLRGKVKMIAITMGGDGALLVTADNHLFLKAPEVEVKSASGAGDSFVGGMVYGLASGLIPKDAFRLGVASGSASVIMPGTQLCRKEDVDRILEEIGAHHNNW